MPYCQQFKAEIQKWKKELEEVKVLLGEYLESGKEEKVGEVREKIKEISDSQEEFLEGEFEAQVKRMFNKWCPHGIQFILDYLDVGKEGRVTLSRHLDLRGTGASYCPLLLKQIQDNLNVSGTKITSLDELEVIKGDFACIDTPSLQSVKKLKMVEGDMYMTRSRITRVDALQEVTGRLDISGSSALKSCKRLVSIGGFLNIRKVHMQNFREAFPILKTIGEHNGVSVMLSKGQEELKSQIEALREQGELNFTGGVYTYS